MVRKDEIKKEVRRLVDEANTAVDQLTKGTTIKSCDIHRLSIFLGDVAEARGAAGVMIKLFPDDADTKEMWQDAANTHNLGYRQRDRFIIECECKEKFVRP